MAPDLTIVIPVWDQHTRLLPRCLQAIRTEPVTANLVLVDNASNLPFKTPPDARRITLTERVSIGAARNAGLEHVNTPFVVFADADDEIALGSLARSLALLERQPDAPGVLGRSIVEEHGRHRRGITPHTAFRLASHHTPSLAPLFWLIAFQCSITSTVLRTASVRDAGGFPDTNIAEDWQLAAHLSRRGRFICLDEPVRIYHRHPAAARNTNPHQPIRTLQQDVWSDCLRDPRANSTHRLLASILRLSARSRGRLRSSPEG
jgi:cellulose synthase/poly-beta-1,6-N-acetylglucosamine synthase-like glycosyltransferase